ncbi:MAG TPA: exodeoxyribonuclease VII large subunit [Propionibacteriaceae bacterium]|nr:exodeoxyribonuclease VII large subunit [Propionibacteriaceae bacterium]
MALESSPEHPQPLRVIARAVRGWVERLGAVWVEAQLIEINRRSGTRTIFLTLRDKLAEVSVSVTTSPITVDLAGPLAEGATVVARIKPTFYESSGRFIFTCDAITPIGEGQLLARLEQTKRLLQAEGLFDRSLKKPLPFLPRAVGLITGEGSAAERDVMENTRRRWPAVRIVTRYALVQGPQACEQLIAAVQHLDRHPEVEVIVIARGGGSVEDLLPFSDEGLIRAVAACRTPVVSAIGHESDSPILDLVADYRASTPTDAAKRVVPDVADERVRVQQARQRMVQAVSRLVGRQQELLDGLRSRPVLTDPTATFGRRYEQLVELRHRATRAIGSTIDRESSLVGHHLARIRAMSPQATLDRGYSILLGRDGAAVRSVNQVDLEDDLVAQLAEGQLAVKVTELRSRGGA